MVNILVDCCQRVRTLDHQPKIKILGCQKQFQRSRLTVLDKIQIQAFEWLCEKNTAITT